MKNLIASLALLTFSFPALADDLYVCSPTKANGLGITRIDVSVSSEDPQALMTVTQGSHKEESWMATEEDHKMLSLVPETDRDGEISVRIAKLGNGKYEASVAHSMIDTFSILSCTLQKKNYAVVDLTGKRFRSNSLNTMEDSMINSDGYALLLDGKLNRDFNITAKASLPGNECSFELVAELPSGSLIEVFESSEVDSGETCTLTIKRSSNEQIEIEVYTTGT